MHVPAESEQYKEHVQHDTYTDTEHLHGVKGKHNY